MVCAFVDEKTISSPRIRDRTRETTIPERIETSLEIKLKSHSLEIIIVTNQALFLDEKKFKLGELINRGFGVGYSPIGGTRLPRVMSTIPNFRPILPKVVEVLGLLVFCRQKITMRKGTLGSAPLL